jgi:NodT family efflux transporter outer membrane factor (OMF) lipoprotein
MKKILRYPWVPAILATAGLAACTVVPDYVRPEMPVPAEFKEAKYWHAARPQDHLPKGPWWEMFNDPVLNGLERQVEISNQNIRAAEAQYRQAQAQAQIARAGYYPVVGASVAVTRARSPESGLGAGAGTGTGTARVATTHTLSLDASWEPDLWGRVRRLVEAGEAGVQASAADLESARLSAQATLAQNYFLLRVADEQKHLFDRSVADYRKSLEIVRNQYEAGVVSRADVVQAETQLRSTEALALDVGVDRASLEHSIALLIGKAPADFGIAPAPFGLAIPSIPLGVPADLLERRPDIASAERHMAAANAQIGVARSAYFPTLTLSGAAGFASTSLAHWITAPARFWSVGSALAETLFSGGLRKAQTAQAVAAYDQNVAVYRQTALGALQEVEDNLAALRILEDEVRVQDDAVKAARESVEITMNQYRAGTVNYLSVVTTEATALANERTALSILGRRFSAAVLLIKALGGGWEKPSTPGA